jgi:hypothetical protein
MSVGALEMWRAVLLADASYATGIAANITGAALSAW